MMARIIFNSILRHTRFRGLYELSDRNDKELKDGLERKKDRARQRTKAVRESAIIARRRREHTLTPGVKIIGSSLFDKDKEVDVPKSYDELKEIVISYLLKKGGFPITEDHRLESITGNRDSEDVMEVQIARIVGLHEQWGLDRKFISKSIFAHRFENGTVFEHSLVSYGGFVSRTYYVVIGNEFCAFAQRNFRKPSD
ncbi:MAG: hypothetical protein ACFFCX_14955 [Candidatus Sifarchaeia archaeon]